MTLLFYFAVPSLGAFTLCAPEGSQVSLHPDIPSNAERTVYLITRGDDYIGQAILVHGGDGVEQAITLGREQIGVQRDTGIGMVPCLDGGHVGFAQFEVNLSTQELQVTAGHHG